MAPPKGMPAREVAMHLAPPLLSTSTLPRISPSGEVYDASFLDDRLSVLAFHGRLG